MFDPPRLAGFQMVRLSDLIGLGDADVASELSADMLRAVADADPRAAEMVQTIVVGGANSVQPTAEDEHLVEAMNFLAGATQSHFPTYSTYWRDLLEKAASGLVEMPPDVLAIVEHLLFGRTMFGEHFASEGRYYAWLTHAEACRLFDFVERTRWCREIFDFAGAGIWTSQIRAARLDIWIYR
jgi:hypothetical protein